MLWRYERGVGIRLAGGSPEQIDDALGAIGAFKRSGPRDADTTGGRLADDLKTGLLKEYVVFSLSAWCNSGGQRRNSVQPAQRVSEQLFDDHILPRLRGVNIDTREGQDRLQQFLKDSGTLVGTGTGGTASPSGLSASDEQPAASGGFPIRGRGGQIIRTVEEWFRHAPPAGGELHWREGRSAMELARRWQPGRVPEEVQRLLEGTKAFVGFVPESGSAECKTPLDGYGGNTRNHDLVVTGSVQGARVNLDIEGKADETFGQTIDKELVGAEAYLLKNPRSKKLARVRELCAAVFNREPAAVGGLRYQLLHAVAAALIRAREDGADRVAFIVHEFRSTGVREVQAVANAADLAAFVRALGGDAAPLAAGKMVGPLFVPGNTRVPADVALYIGKAGCAL